MVLSGCHKQGAISQISEDEYKQKLLKIKNLPSSFFGIDELENADDGTVLVNLKGKEYSGDYVYSLEPNKYHCNAGVLNFFQHFDSKDNLGDAKERGQVTLISGEARINCEFISSCENGRYVGICSDPQGTKYALEF